MNDSSGPVERPLIARHQTQPGHTCIVDRGKTPSGLRHSTISDRGIVETVFANSLSLRSLGNVEQNAKHFPSLWVSIIKEELRVRGRGIPVEHRALLWIPASTLINHPHGISILRVDQDDVGDVIRPRHTILK